MVSRIRVFGDLGISGLRGFGRKTRETAVSSLRRQQVRAYTWPGHFEGLKGIERLAPPKRHSRARLSRVEMGNWDFFLYLPSHRESPRSLYSRCPVLADPGQ